jgi:hypothetical protein
MPVRHNGDINLRNTLKSSGTSRNFSIIIAPEEPEHSF